MSSRTLAAATAFSTALVGVGFKLEPLLPPSPRPLMPWHRMAAARSSSSARGRAMAWTTTEAGSVDDQNGLFPLIRDAGLCMWRLGT